MMATVEKLTLASKKVATPRRKDHNRIILCPALLCSICLAGPRETALNNDPEVTLCLYSNASLALNFCSRGGPVVYWPLSVVWGAINDSQQGNCHPLC